MSSIKVTHQGDITTLNDGSKSVVWMDNNRDGKFGAGDDVIEGAKTEGSSVNSWRVDADYGTNLSGDPHLYKFLVTKESKDNVRATLGQTLERAAQGGAVTAAEFSSSVAAYENAASDRHLVGHMQADFTYVQGDGSRLAFEMVKADPAHKVTFVQNVTVSTATGQAVSLQNLFSPGETTVSHATAKVQGNGKGLGIAHRAASEFHEVAGVNIHNGVRLFGEISGKKTSAAQLAARGEAQGTILRDDGNVNNDLGVVSMMAARVDAAYQRNESKQMAAYALSLQSTDEDLKGSSKNFAQLRLDVGWDSGGSIAPEEEKKKKKATSFQQLRQANGWDKE